MKPFIIQLKRMFDKHADEVFQYCYLGLKDRHRALKMTEETFVKASHLLQQGKKAREVEMSLCSIVHRLLVKEHVSRMNKMRSLKKPVPGYT